MPSKTTTCSRDCPDVCTIQVETNSEGKAIRLKGSNQDPVTQGFLCERTSRFLARQYSQDRLTQPLMRESKDAPLRPVSWDAALDFCAQRLLACRAESGPASILHYRSGGSLGILKQLSDLLFESFGPVTIKRGDICSGAGEAAQEADFGLCDSHDHLDLHNSRNILLWGKNVHTSAPHLLPLLLELKQKGTRLIGIDPVRTRQATLVDTFIQPNPGTDFALAMAVAKELLQGAPLDPSPDTFCDYWKEFQELVMAPRPWLELCGVSHDQVKILAQVLRERPTALLIGWGLGRRANGGACIRALDALAAISGNLGLPGGGASYYFRRRAAFDRLPIQGLEVAPRSFLEAQLGQEILQAQPAIRFAWVTAGNPISMLPDSNQVRKAFQSIETVVVVDTHPTDTTDCADVIFPTLTMLEDDDLLGSYGNHYLRVSRPALEPPPGLHHELWIWQQLAQRLGLGSLLEGSPREWKQRLTQKLQRSGLPLEQLEQGPVRSPFAPRVLFEDRHFPTPTGRVQLIHHEPSFPPIDPEYPLQLSAFAHPKAQASQWSIPVPERLVARVHPSSASGFVDGQEVTLETRMGQVRVLLQLDDSVHPRQILLPKGGMMRQGGCPNQLIGAVPTDLGEGANYYDQPARLRS